MVFDEKLSWFILGATWLRQISWKSIQYLVQTFYPKPHMVDICDGARGNVRESPNSSNHPLRTTKVCTNVCVNPSGRCKDVSQNQWKLWLAGSTRGKSSKSPMSLGFILWAPCTSEPNLITVHTIVVEIVQYNQKSQHAGGSRKKAGDFLQLLRYFSDGPTDRPIPGTTPLAWLKMHHIL